MNNNEYRNFEALDLLTLISFLAQIQNMNEDTKEKTYIHEVIKAISIEIEKLHKQNERIEAKIDQILERNKNDFN